MLSEPELLFLNRCLRDVLTTVNIRDIEFTEDRVKDVVFDVDIDESELTRGQFDSRGDHRCRRRGDGG